MSGARTLDAGDVSGCPSSLARCRFLSADESDRHGPPSGFADLISRLGGPLNLGISICERTRDERPATHLHFTNSLVGESVLEGADPLLGGASGRLWASSDGRLRLELQADVSKGSAGDLELLVDGRDVTLYDPGTETVYEGQLPSHKGGEEGGEGRPPSLAQVQEGIETLMKHADLSGADPSDVAGQPAYTVRLSPKANGGLLGGAELAWDAANGVPLRATVYANGESSPVLEIAATEISFGSAPRRSSKSRRRRAPSGSSSAHPAKAARAPAHP